jgi:hypothetical protein
MSRTRILSSIRLAIVTGKSGWQRTPPGISWLPSIPCRLTATLSPALAMLHGLESRWMDFTVASCPQGKTNTCNREKRARFQKRHKLNYQKRMENENKLLHNLDAAILTSCYWKDCHHTTKIIDSRINLYTLLLLISNSQCSRWICKASAWKRF